MVEEDTAQRWGHLPHLEVGENGGCGPSRHAAPKKCKDSDPNSEGLREGGASHEDTAEGTTWTL